MSKKGRFVQMASQSAKNMLYCTCETGKLSGGAPGPVGSSPYGKISVCGRSMKKRILSCLMALVQCLTLLPTAALAGAKPLTAALPYRRGEFSTLSTDAFITLNGVVPILGQLHVYFGEIDICDRFAMQKHRRMKNVRFLVPAGQPEMIHERFMHRLYAFLWRAAHT